MDFVQSDQRANRDCVHSPPFPIETSSRPSSPIVARSSSPRPIHPHRSGRSRSSGFAMVPLIRQPSSNPSRKSSLLWPSTRRLVRYSSGDEPGMRNWPHSKWPRSRRLLTSDAASVVGFLQLCRLGPTTGFWHTSALKAGSRKGMYPSMIHQAQGCHPDLAGHHQFPGLVSGRGSIDEHPLHIGSSNTNDQCRW